jgi:hypothetical protein
MYLVHRDQGLQVQSTFPLLQPSFHSQRWPPSRPWVCPPTSAPLGDKCQAGFPFILHTMYVILKSVFFASEVLLS